MAKNLKTQSVKIIQKIASSPTFVSRAPTDCLQYFTGVSNRFSSFNYQNGVTGQLLNNQNYYICIRQEEGSSNISGNSLA